MDFSTLLSIHSLFRWVILLIIILVLIRSYKGKRAQYSFKNADKKIRSITIIVCWIQLFLGFTLYSKSAIVDYFFNNLPDALSLREIRFFGMEHSTAMPLSILFLSIGAYRSYKIQNINSTKAYKLWFNWTITGFLFIIFSIPWSFWPLVSRPLFRF